MKNKNINLILKPIILMINYLIIILEFLTNILRRVKQKIRVTPWRIIDGDKKLRFTYPLSDESIVFDVGGYKGEWSEKIYNKYKNEIYVFEPIKKFESEIDKKFSNNDDVHVFNFGLGKNNEKILINIEDDASSVYTKDKGNKEEIEIRSISDFIRENKIEKVDLIKINIEGGEYDLLEDLIESDLIKIVENIQVQFHEISKNSYKEMNKIREELAKSHNQDYAFDFVWENWSLNK